MHSGSEANKERLIVRSSLGRAGFGARPADVEAVAARGFRDWIEEQLAPDDKDDLPCAARLARFRLAIRYAAGEGHAALDEQRALVCLDAPIASLWRLTDRKLPMDGAERRRPRDEVVAATLIRAVHSRWQLREVLAGFWHDHFNVDAYSSDQIAVALPIYDRAVIRPHVLGNFRDFLEAVATSTAMQYYLSNKSSRAGAANENYARELFELHTLGRAAYLNDRYDRWREVPGATTGEPRGYIDQDVYEAARAFTGWTVADGAGIDGGRKLPASGEFAYVESWHDGYQKRVLARDFDAFQPPMADGRRTLDLLARHPATADFLASKLCHRFVGESASRDLIARTSREWLHAVDAPDQIARVVRVILMSNEFAAGVGSKTRRPIALVAAFARASALDLTPTEPLANELAASGQRLFGWPTPTGLPDTTGTFVTTQGLRHRWSMILALAENSWHGGELPGPDAMGLAGRSTRDAASFWLRQLTGDAPAASVDALVAGVGGAADRPIEGPDGSRRWTRLAALAGMTPAFQVV